MRAHELIGALDKTTIAKTWQQYHEDHGYGLWGLSPSPTAKILSKAILDSNPRRSELVEIVDWGCWVEPRIAPQTNPCSRQSKRVTLHLPPSA